MNEVRKVVLAHTTISEAQYDKLPKYVQEAFALLVQGMKAEVRRREEMLEQMRVEYQRTTDGTP